MAVEDPTFDAVEEQKIEAPIPSMLTTSAVEMLETFSTDIIEIKAQASVDTTNPDSMLRRFGLHREQTQSLSVMLDYQQIREHEPGEGVVVQNPLTDTAIENIIHEMRVSLNDPDLEVDPDLAVSKLVLNVTSEALKTETRARSNEFELTFVSDPAHPTCGDDRGARSLTQQKNNHRGLYTELGFNIRNLNLHRIEETQAKYSDQGDALLMSWQGSGDTRPNSTDPIASVVKDEVLPDEYVATKWYVASDADDTDLAKITTGGVQ